MDSNWLSDINSSIKGFIQQYSFDIFKTSLFGKTLKQELSEEIGGGPHNLGDPEDTSLRPLDKDVINYMAWFTINSFKCGTERDAYEEHCAESKDSQKCSVAYKSLSTCLKEYYEDRIEEVEAECTPTYLELRKAYRQTADQQYIEKIMAMMPLYTLKD